MALQNSRIKSRIPQMVKGTERKLDSCEKTEHVAGKILLCKNWMVQFYLCFSYTLGG